ncbi:hypothetical protein BC829DRAFT_215408 [Chytridium lagenaria]|nr:hypothetical protein BC829DRAFT_215408 [Chytridium lagenaria]
MGKKIENLLFHPKSWHPTTAPSKPSWKKATNAMKKKSDDSFDVSDLSQLSEAEAAASDSWSESERDPKPKNQDLKKMNQAFNNLVVVSESKPTVNEPPRKSVPQSSDTFSDFDSDSESFGGTKLGTKPIAAGKKPFPVKNNAFASTANGSNVHNARKLTDKDSFSMDDSDLEVQMI